jgi:ubiquinone/menaquinone biosynthesis C-methylase UbiE
MTMRETADIETSSADYARRFAGRAGKYLLGVQSQTVRRIIADMTPGTVLDVGGGHGQLVDDLGGLGWRVTVLGSDAQCERNLRELHGKRDCEFVGGDLLDMPFADGQFDLVISVRLISHVAAWQRLLREFCRVARRSVVIDYPSVKGINSLTPLLFGMKKAFEGNTRTYSSFARADIDAVLAAASFETAREIKQFFLPMVLHRAMHAAAPVRWAEGVSRGLGLTALFGSPVVLRADRIQNPHP